MYIYIKGPFGPYSTWDSSEASRQVPSLLQAVQAGPDLWSPSNKHHAK